MRTKEEIATDLAIALKLKVFLDMTNVPRQNAELHAEIIGRSMEIDREIYALREEQRQRIEQPKDQPLTWKPIETAPRDDDEIIVGYYQATVWITRSAYWWASDDEGAGWWSYYTSVGRDKLYGHCMPTHWLCRTNPPKDQP